MSIADDIAREIITQKRVLANMRVLPEISAVTAAVINNPPLLFRDMKVIEQMLRVEIEEDDFPVLLHAMPHVSLRDEVYGKGLFMMGVAVYPVRHTLPAPRWRVINPLAPR